MASVLQRKVGVVKILKKVTKLISDVKEGVIRKKDEIMDNTGYEYLGQRLSFADEDGAGVTLDIPGYRQTKAYTCGFVAGLMVLHTFKPKASADSFYYRCDPDEDTGMSTGQLAKALRASKVGVSVRRKMSFSQIRREINNGHPIITTVEKPNGDEHWVVIYGFDVDPDRVFVAGNGLPIIPVSTSVSWTKFSSKLPDGGDFLVCWGK